MKQFIALARVSSREQEREGFSLEVQEDALRQYAGRAGGTIVKLFRVAETASKHDERASFKSLLEYVRKNASTLSGVLFYKVDRAARNLFDYVELEKLEQETGVPVIYTTQPTENTPAGKLQRRILANMATYYTEQQALDVREGMERRVKSGLFCGKAPFGYRNVRIDGRSIVEAHPVNSETVRRIFDLYAYQGATLKSVCETLKREGRKWSDRKPDFSPSTVHDILRDRAYVGEVLYHNAWLSGSHSPLIPLSVFSRVQTLLGNKTYNAHSSVYGSGKITCGHCGRPIVVEIKTKRTKAGEKEYFYYRCAGYTAPGHPRFRYTERQLDEHMLSLFRKLRIADGKVSKWLGDVLRARVKTEDSARTNELERLQKEERSLYSQTQRLIRLHLLREVEEAAYRAMSATLGEELSTVRLRIEALSRNQQETADVAIGVFELSQQLENKWLVADIAVKRMLLEFLCLNFIADNASLNITMNKPFSVIAEGLTVQSGRGDWI